MSSLLVGVIDYGRGNLRSVSKALEAVGANIQLLPDPEQIDRCAALVLPGVGAFGDCSRSLKQRGFTKPLQDWLAANKPFLGICLGYQILFESSEESPAADGLGFFSGKVRRFASEPGKKIPHMGWNSLSFTDNQPIFRNLPKNPFVYFVHSFYPAPENSEIVSSWCNYGISFASSVSAGNIHAVQFHPEKSQELGLQILKNFISLAQNQTP